MNDDRVEPILSTWLKDTAVTSPDAERTTRAVMARLPGVRQRGRWRQSADARSTAAGALRSTFSSVKLVGAASLVAVFSAVVLLGAPATPRPGERSPLAGAAGSPGVDEPAIHWRSSVVDLRADSMTLRIGEETFTTEGVDVVVDAYNGDLAQWALNPRWVEDGQTFWLYLDFSSDGESWVLGPWLWLDGVVGSDGNVHGDNVDFDPSGWIRLPLGQPYEGDWRLTGWTEVATCDPRSAERVDVSLTFEGLRLAVAPRAPSLIEQLEDDWFHRGSLLGDLVHGELQHPEPRPLVCPEPSSHPRAEATSAP